MLNYIATVSFLINPYVSMGNVIHLKKIMQSRVMQLHTVLKYYLKFKATSKFVAGCYPREVDKSQRAIGSGVHGNTLLTYAEKSSGGDAFS